MSRELHPDLEEMLREAEASGVPDLADLSVGAARSRNRELLAVEANERDAVGRVRDLEISGPNGPIPIRIYESETTGPRPVFVYFHGGGWVFGTTGAHDQTCRAIANAGECTVVSIDYRLAPEHPFPAGLEDCYAATVWAANHGDVLSGDEESLVVGGDSSGGNLAAAVSLLSRDRDGPDVAHQFLLYPPLDRNFGTASYEENAEGYVLTRDTMRWVWDLYLERPVDEKNPYAAPLQARDLSGLPPATIIAAEFDPLRDENAAYADRLSEAGVSVEYRSHEDMTHGFVQLVGDLELEATREEIALIGETVRSL